MTALLPAILGAEEVLSTAVDASGKGAAFARSVAFAPPEASAVAIAEAGGGRLDDAFEVLAEKTWTGRSVPALLQCLYGVHRLTPKKKVCFRVIQRLADVLQGVTDGTLDVYRLPNLKVGMATGPSSFAPQICGSTLRKICFEGMVLVVGCRSCALLKRACGMTPRR